jgi:hypothetical protein
VRGHTAISGRHLKNENGTKVRAQFIFDASTRAQLKRIALKKFTKAYRERAAEKKDGTANGAAISH